MFANRNLEYGGLNTPALVAGAFDKQDDIISEVLSQTEWKSKEKKGQDLKRVVGCF